MSVPVLAPAPDLVPASLPLFVLPPEHESELELGPVSVSVDLLFVHSVPLRVVAVEVDVDVEEILCKRFLKGMIVGLF